MSQTLSIEGLGGEKAEKEIGKFLFSCDVVVQEKGIARGHHVGVGEVVVVVDVVVVIAVVVVVVVSRGTPRIQIRRLHFLRPI